VGMEYEFTRPVLDLQHAPGLLLQPHWQTVTYLVFPISLSLLANKSSAVDEIGDHLATIDMG